MEINDIAEVAAILKCTCGSETFYHSEVNKISDQYITCVAECTSCKKKYGQELHLIEFKD